LSATPRILRPGGITAEQLGEALQMTVAAGSEAGPLHSPGQLASHYAPILPLRLDAVSVGAGEALLAFGARPPAAAFARNLSAAGDLEEAAANLFAMLRELDRPEFTGIAVMPIPETGLGVAINDRLRRAAAPR
jgi:L-threonylcarbamoyladenylate synthase